MPGFSNTWAVNFQMFKLVLEKAEKQRSNCRHPMDNQKSKRVPEKTSISALLTMPKPLTVWITISCGNFWRRWESQTTWPASWETCMQVRKQVRTGHGTTDWFQIGKGVHQGCILSPCLTYIVNLYAEYIMRTAGLEQAGIKIAWRNINNLRYTHETTLWQKVKKN